MVSKEDKKVYERNITLSYIIGSLMWGRFFIPVLALFYIASQVSLEQFAIIMGVFSLAILVLEVPSGVFADLVGKKKTLLISRAMFVIEIALIAFFDGFWIFFIAKIISGIGVSLSSGTSSALLFDSLKRLGREKEHKRISGKLFSITSVSSAFVFIVGAYLFSIHYKLPALVSLPFITLGFVLNFWLKEPYPSKKKANFSSSLKHFKEGISYFSRLPYLRYLAFFTFAVGGAIPIMLSISSAYYKEVLIPVAFIGVLAFLGSMATAFSSKKAHSWEEKLGDKKSLFLIQISLIIVILLTSLVIPYWGALFYLLISFILGFYQVILGDYVNNRVETSHRATMLSVNNMFGNIGTFILFPIIGYLIGAFSMSIALALFGGFLALYFVVFFLFKGVLNSSGYKLDELESRRSKTL